MTLRPSGVWTSGYNRGYDTIELEKNLDDAERILSAALEARPEETVLSSHLINAGLGRQLAERGSGFQGGLLGGGH